MYIQYEHHGKTVWVRKDLKGRHREHCLCYDCSKFVPGSEKNCPIASALYQLDVFYNITTPVFECVEFLEK